MSIYYSAYLAKKKANGHYEVIGPYVYNKDGELNCECIWWRSQSFIHWHDFDALSVAPELFDGEVTKKLMTSTLYWEGEKVYSIGYWLPANAIYARGSGEPIRGFLPVDEAKELIGSGYDQEYITWGMESSPVGAEFVAGLSDEERNKYSFVSYMDYQSQKYHFWELGRILSGFEDYQLVNDDEEFGVLFQVG